MDDDVTFILFPLVYAESTPACAIKDNIIGSIEDKSSHPIAQAFSDYMEENKLKAYNEDIRRWNESACRGACTYNQDSTPSKIRFLHRKVYK